jgi:hypothetical protein
VSRLMFEAALALAIVLMWAGAATGAVYAVLALIHPLAAIAIGLVWIYVSIVVWIFVVERA